MTSIIAIELNTNPVHANIHHLNQSRKLYCSIIIVVEKIEIIMSYHVQKFVQFNEKL